jgi:hypothetical protein
VESLTAVPSAEFCNGSGMLLRNFLISANLLISAFSSSFIVASGDVKKESDKRKRSHSLRQCAGHTR